MPSPERRRVPRADMLFHGRRVGMIVGTARRNVYLTSLVHSCSTKNGTVNKPPTPQSLSLGRENDREVRARSGLYPYDGLSKRPAGHVLQLHPNGPMAVASRLPNPGERPESRRARPSHPRAVWPSEDRRLPRTSERT